VPAERLISDNGLTNPNNLVVGQSIVIVYPKQTYIIQEGALLNNVTIKNELFITILVKRKKPPHTFTG
jgi:spore germination protein